MRYSLLLACVGFITGAWSITGHTQQSNGWIRLTGSSFGVLGVNATFDYVVIGGGTSGLTVANRLASNPAVSVAVIEGGSFYEIDNGNISQIPALDVKYSSPSPTTIQPLVDWGIVTVPQNQLDGREIHYTQGKCLGGSSGRNYLAYQRGTSGSYQQWANQVGDQSYTFDNILRYFKRSPEFTPPNYSKRGARSEISYDPTAFNSDGGPLHVSYSNFYQPISNFVKQAFLSLGLQNIAGLNSGKLIGFSEFTLTIDPQSGTRSSSETSFLQDSIASSTLQVYQKTLARRIIFDRKKTAKGVNVVTGGTEYTLFATKEVILAAGVFRSPQLLMVSGVGPSATLEGLDIPLVSKSEGVGQGMWDQPLYGVTYKVNVTTNSQLLVNPGFFSQATKDYLSTQTGPLDSAGGNWVGWEKLPQPLRSQLSNSTISDLARFSSDWPELEILPLAATTATVTDTDNYFSVSIAVLATTSRGNVTINSTDTNDNPLVSPNWLLTTTDQELAVQGFKRAREIAKATGITIGPETSPGVQTQTDAQILEYIKQDLAPIHHASATCAMGGRNASNAVVDPYGKVYGVQSLRIVDASIFPLLPPGHPQSTVFEGHASHLADQLNSSPWGKVDEDVIGKSGPIQASFPEFHGPLGKAWPETFRNLGFAMTTDPLSGQSSGGFSYLSSIDPKTWERSHAGSAYYAPVADRPNLRLLTDSLVERIILEKSGSDVVATGVQLTRNGNTEVRKAKKEVLLCAGVFQSPQILEHSGVGSAKLLQSHGIDVLVENPNIGENLQDHPMSGMCLEVIDGLPTIDMIRDPAVIQGAMEAYQSHRTGPLTSGFHSVASLPVVEFLSEKGKTELTQLLDKYTENPTPSQPASQNRQPAILRSILESPSDGSIIIGMGASQLHFHASLQKDIYAITDPANYLSFLVALAHPYSRGTVHIESASPTTPPRIDPRYLSHPLDVEILARHMRYIPTIANTQPLASLIKEGGKRLPKGMDISTLEAAKEHVKRNLITNNHPCGTCAMLPEADGGVVDERLRVHGVRNLRVVDASVFPMIPRGNIQSSVYAVAERAADLIQEDQK